jgi:hypothetical protein
LDYHFFTQPLPTWVAWYFQNLPEFAHKILTGATLVVELLIPPFFFFPRKFRKIAFWMQIAFQFTIALTGNYTYFNLLTALLCFFLLAEEAVPPPAKAPTPILYFFSVALLLGGLLQLLSVFQINVPAPLSWISNGEERFQMLHGYGLFAVMTRERNELEIQGSDDGKNWRPYAFRWKPGDVTRRPPFIAPYQPRVDWQAWFASLSTFDREFWLQSLLTRIFENEPTVLALFAGNPFADHPPRFLRVMQYAYRFTTPEEKRRDGAWWRRSEAAPYSPVLSKK